MIDRVNIQRNRTGRARMKQKKLHNQREIGNHEQINETESENHRNGARVREH